MSTEGVIALRITVSNWVEQFQQFSIQNGLSLDICWLTNLPDWQKLIVKVMKD